MPDLTPGDDRLDVTCWCEAEVGRIPAREVAAGRTFSCGRLVCKPVGVEGRA